MSTPIDVPSQGLISEALPSRRTGIILCCRDAGANWPKEQFENLKTVLEQRLSCFVSIVHSIAEPEFIAGEIEQIARLGVNEVTFVPVSLLPLDVAGTISHVINWAARHFPSLQIQIAPALRWSEFRDWICSTLQSTVKESDGSSEASAVLLCGTGSIDSLQNADLARLAQLVAENSAFFRVSAGFLTEVRPSFEEVMASFDREPIQNILIVPWQFSELDRKHLSSLCSSWTSETGKSTRVIEMQLGHPALVNLLIANSLAAVPWNETKSTESFGDANQLTAAEEFELQQLRARIDALLPSEYQGRFESVSPQSMGTAKLKTDEAGQVAWDQIWTSFCDLALAGGPPHRGKLLEAVASEEARADPAAYQLVVDEIRRGIGLVTHLITFESPTPGWVGIQCENEEMAVWLMRAIIVENVMVRREGANLFLPAGPKFTVSKEIKNVITSVAKTVHYWQAHLKARKNGLL